MIDEISPQRVRLSWICRRELALFDVREENDYAKGHPLFAASLPLSRIELEIFDRVPRRTTTIVLYDNGEGFAAIAARLLTPLGYRNVLTLAGGLESWRNAGYELFQDVNSASKAFGELVESCRHTPSVQAEKLKALLDQKANAVVLDARPFEEYRRMHVPAAVNVPGAELVLRARDLAPDPSTTIIVSCAGRTRSIVGTQSLINAGLPNPILALRNGTIGWTLAGQELECGEGRAVVFEKASEGVDRAAARGVSYRAGVRHISWNDMLDLARDPERTLYRFDVRGQDEYVAGHPRGFRHAPGGQLIQETDVFAPVRGARIVVADPEYIRADMTASWLAQMGWEAYVLDDGFDREFERGDWTTVVPAAPACLEIAASSLSRALNREHLVLDFALSTEFQNGHVPGAWFIRRACLGRDLSVSETIKTVVVTSADGCLARYVMPEVQAALTHCKTLALTGGTAAWIDAGYPLDTGLGRTLCKPEDVYRRPYVDAAVPKQAMQAYLDWEFGLVAQLERDGSHGFYVI